jgi:hypothetical protein
MVTVIERTEGRYEVQEVEFGRVYKWLPERVVVECGCSRTLSLTTSGTTCDCGADHAAVVRQELSAKRLGGNRPPHPWRHLHYSEGTGIPF